MQIFNDVVLCKQSDNKWLLVIKSTSNNIFKLTVWLLTDD